MYCLVTATHNVTLGHVSVPLFVHVRLQGYKVSVCSLKLIIMWVEVFNVHL